KPAEVIADDAAHGHLHRRREVALRHLLLLFRRLQYLNESVGKIHGIPDFVEIDRHILVRGHVAKIGDISTHDGNSVLTSLMGWSTRASCGISRHNHDRGCREEVRNCFFWNISAELDTRARAE